MSSGRAELVSTSSETLPFKMVFWRDDQIVAEIPVSSPDAAMALANDLLKKLEAVRDR
jgi:hypothetical protein